MITYRPRARVTIVLSSHDNAVLDVSDDLMTLSTSKAFGRAAGGWQLTLPYRERGDYGGLRYDELIVTDDLITIDMDAGNGDGFQRVMVGLVSRVARTFGWSGDGIPQRHIKITGLDLGKLLIKHDCGWDIALREGVEGPPDLQRISQGLFFTGTAAKIGRSIFEILFLQHVTDMTRLFEFVATTDDTWEYYNYAINYSTGAVWNALKQCANEPYNILHTETVADLAVKRLRVLLQEAPIALNGKLSAKIEMHEAAPAEIVAEDVGVCDDDRVSYCWFKPVLTIQGVDDSVPIWYVENGMLNQDAASVRRHGAQMHIVETRFGRGNVHGQETPADTDYLTEASIRSEGFWRRIKDNHKYESGSFALHLRPDIRAGNGLLHSGYDKEYLIEQVDHRCVFGERPSFATTLAVTRGQKA